MKINPEFTPLIIVLIGAIIALFNYSYQKKIDRKQKLFELKLKMYEELLWNMGAVIAPNSKDDGTQFVACMTKMNLYASDKAIIAFNQIADMGSSENYQLRYKTFLLEARKDCLGEKHTKLSPYEIAGKKI